MDEAALKQRNIYQNCSVVANCHKEGHEQAVSTWMCIENKASAATTKGLEAVPKRSIVSNNPASPYLGVNRGRKLPDRRV